jgi:hypothetical protein
VVTLIAVASDNVGVSEVRLFRVDTDGNTTNSNQAAVTLAN